MSGNKEEEDPRINGIKTKIRVVPDFPKKGIMFQDITTVLLDPKAFKDTIDLFVERYRDKNISVVAGILSLISPNRLRRVVSSAAFPAGRIVLVVAAAVVTVASVAATLSGVVVTSVVSMGVLLSFVIFL
ncbi:hypothetical protein F2Q70_00036119 [Brassica cretica]|uniref:adenine phosphoribosyltransferase n=1 Tax=Brassica cretica TaxID=69181 RepID=A0A8S9JYV0_BRACR|nr:hypothetical protein F2Q70_00036119 [Brassica cretica]